MGERVECLTYGEKIETGKRAKRGREKKSESSDSTRLFPDQHWMKKGGREEGSTNCVQNNKIK